MMIQPVVRPGVKIDARRVATVVSVRDGGQIAKITVRVNGVGLDFAGFGPKNCEGKQACKGRNAGNISVIGAVGRAKA